MGLQSLYTSNIPLYVHCSLRCEAHTICCIALHVLYALHILSLSTYHPVGLSGGDLQSVLDECMNSRFHQLSLPHSVMVQAELQLGYGQVNYKLKN